MGNVMDYNKWLVENKIERMDANHPMFTESRRRFHLARYQFVLDRVEYLGAVADIACGTGYGTKMLSEIAFRVVGIDISQDAINYAEHFYGGVKMKYLCSDLFRLNPATCLLDFGPFDCVVSFETLEHVTDGRGFVKIMSSILKPCGIFVVSTPNNWGITKYHKVNYTLDSFMDVLQSEFDIIEMFNQNSGGTHIFNHKQRAGIVPTTETNRSLAECYIAICRKRI